MEQFIRRLRPRFLRPYVRKVYRKFSFRETPRFTTLPYDNFAVLQCCIAYNKYGGYCVPLSSRHRPVAQKILAGRVYEPETIDLMVSSSSEGDIVHAGTYFGDFLPPLSRSRAPNAKVWAFEPNLENYRCSQITTSINDLRNVELRNVGLGEGRGAAVMMTADEAGKSLGGISRIVQEDERTPSARTERVEIVALDEVVPLDRRVSIIHLDVEGYERQALAGALKTIRRCLPIIVLETLPDEKWLSENIFQLGYRMTGRVHHNGVFSCN